MKILVAEDDVRLARFLVKMLGEEGFVTDLCVDGRQAAEQAASVRYDAILLDWMLPGLDGLSVCRTLRQRGDVTPILMLTARGELGERVLGLDSGADDYLVKPFEIDELLARLRAIVRRSAGATVLQLGELEVDRLRRQVRLSGVPVDLTQREFSLLVHLASRGGELVTRSELLDRVLDLQFDPGTNVLEVHISRLRGKLGVHGAMVETVRGFGYRLRAKETP